MMRCSDFLAMTPALLMGLFRQVYQRVRIDALTLVEYAVYGERRVVEAVVHDVRIRQHRSVFSVAKPLYGEASALIGKGARILDCGVDAPCRRKGGLRVFAFEPQVDGYRLPVEMSARPPCKVEHDQFPTGA